MAGSLKIDDLDYYTGYTLKTKLTYELDTGSMTDLEKTATLGCNTREDCLP